MTARSSGYCFEDFVEITRQVQTTAQLFGTLIEYLGVLGFDRVNFSVLRDSDLPEAAHGFGLISTYPEGWQHLYVSRDYGRIDPVRQSAIGNLNPFLWRDLARMRPLTAQQLAFLKEAENAGLYHGLAIPFSGPKSQRAGVAVATSQRYGAVRPNSFLVNALCNHFYLMFKQQTGSGRAGFSEIIYLTDKEREVLLWVKSGLSDIEVADSMSITRNTVNSHLRRIFEKLGVNNRMQAVVKSLQFGLIEL